MTAKTKTENPPATVASRAVALPFQYGDDAGRGLDLTLDDLLIPFLKLLQDDSKELDEDDDKFIEGAEAGEILNTATKERLQTLLLVPAIKTPRHFVEFTPGTSGAYVGEHEANSEIVRTATGKRNELVAKNGNKLVETKKIFAIILGEDQQPIGYCVVPFSGSKLSAWSSYWTMVDTMRVSTPQGPKKLGDVAPLFALRIRLNSKFQKNAKGKFFNFEMLPEGGGVSESLLGPDAPGYVAAKALAEAIQQGRAKADVASMEGEEATEGKGDRHF